MAPCEDSMAGPGGAGLDAGPAVPVEDVVSERIQALGRLIARCACVCLESFIKGPLTYGV